jgi:hypothetical protein
MQFLRAVKQLITALGLGRRVEAMGIRTQFVTRAIRVGHYLSARVRNGSDTSIR